MGDRAWARFILYACTEPAEVEAICSFLDDRGFSDKGLTELVIFEAYDVDETSLGFVDDAAGLAERTPTSTWMVCQAGYVGPGDQGYHVPGLGWWDCIGDDEPLFTATDVEKAAAMLPTDLARFLGKPWLDVASAYSTAVNDLPPSERPVLKRPAPEELEERTESAPVDKQLPHELPRHEKGICVHCKQPVQRRGTGGLLRVASDASDDLSWVCPRNPSNGGDAAPHDL